jgi:hypothetical protein
MQLGNEMKKIEKVRSPKSKNLAKSLAVPVSDPAYTQAWLILKLLKLKSIASRNIHVRCKKILTGSVQSVRTSL